LTCRAPFVRGAGESHDAILSDPIDPAAIPLLNRTKRWAQFTRVGSVRPSERAYRPDVVERTAKVEAQIEKAIARLANLKEFKRIYAPKTVAGRRLDAVKARSPASSDSAHD